jgi:hypothetical protein
MAPDEVTLMSGQCFYKIWKAGISLDVASEKHMFDCFFCDGYAT